MTQDVHAKGSEQSVDSLEHKKNTFIDGITRLNTVACNFASQDKQGLLEAEQQCKDSIEVLMAKNGAQEMLSAQILSNHNLQQLCTAMGNKLLGDSRCQYYINAAIKLSNSCTSQLALLAKLQGNIGQRIVVEHVDVDIHQGGQAAFVGSVTKEPTQ